MTVYLTPFAFDFACFDERVWLLLAGVVVILMSLASRLEVLKFIFRAPATSGRFVTGVVVGCAFVVGWAVLYLRASDNVIPIAKMVNYEVREHGVYDISDSETNLHVACTDVLFHDSTDPRRAGHSAEFMVTAENDVASAAIVRVSLGEAKVFQASGHLYSIKVVDLHNVKAGPDAAEVTLKRVK